MADCPICGASGESNHCKKCGALISSGSSAPKNRRLAFLAIGGCLGLAIIGIWITIGVVRFMRKTGIDPILMAKQPAHARANIFVKANPELEIVSIDENTGIIRVRNKKSSMLLEMNVKDGRNAKWTMVGFKGKNANRSSSLPFDDSHCPSWILHYPRAMEEHFNPSSINDKNGSIGFITTDPSKKVAEFYQDSFKKNGLKVEFYVHPISNKDPMIHIIARDPGGSRFASMNVNLAPAGGPHERKTVSISFRTSS